MKNSGKWDSKFSEKEKRSVKSKRGCCNKQNRTALSILHAISHSLTRQTRVLSFSHSLLLALTGDLSILHAISPSLTAQTSTLSLCHILSPALTSERCLHSLIFTCYLAFLPSNRGRKWRRRHEVCQLDGSFLFFFCLSFSVASSKGQSPWFSFLCNLNSLSNSHVLCRLQRGQFWSFRKLIGNPLLKVLAKFSLNRSWCLILQASHSFSNKINVLDVRQRFEIHLSNVHNIASLMNIFEYKVQPFPHSKSNNSRRSVYFPTVTTFTRKKRRRE